MNWVVIIFYWFWIFLGIFNFLFVKLCVNTYQHKSFKFPGWVILLYLIALFIPLINIAASITLVSICLEEGYIKRGVVNWFKNLWIIKILAKKY